jgi:carboxypeptidase C (cathepsin A)
MRMLTVSIVIGPLVLIGALPAAGQSTLTLGSGASVQLAAGDSTADRDTYTQRARDEMQEWQRKLHDFSKRAVAKGKEAGSAAENDLNKTWTKAEAASRKLQTVGAEGWVSAKTSFEKASHELADAWHRIRPQDK